MTFLERAGNLLQLIRSIRIVILLSLGSIIALGVPDQILELYVIYAQALSALAGRSAPSASDVPLAIQLTLGILGIVVLAVLLFACTMRLLTIAEPRATEPQPVLRRAHEVTSIMIGLLPTVALIFGFQHARWKLSLQGPDPEHLMLEAYWLNIASLALVGLVALAAFLYFLALRQKIRRGLSYLFSTGGFAIYVAALLIFCATIILFPVQIPAVLGTLAIVALFLMSISYALTCFALVSKRYSVPITSTLFIIAIAFALLDLNDNHRARFALEKLPLPALEESFIQWFGERQDKERYERDGIPYPIYVVAAEGGGLFAAYHAASFLAKAQDECPTFAQHTFAISSVSGGSLGGAMFASLAAERARNRAWEPCRPEAETGDFTRIVRLYFAQDLLSPLIAAGLFPDFLQRFLPWPFPRLDRARALESAFEAAWVKATDIGNARTANPFSQPMNSFGGPSTATPTLFLHATSLQTGSRVTLSPLYFPATPTALHVSDALLAECAAARSVNMPLSTAVSLSARFPWVTPVGWLERGQTEVEGCAGRSIDFGSRLYLLDGGYFENSGLESAIELTARLQRVIDAHPEVFPKGRMTAQVKIIQILTRDRFADRWWNLDGDLATRGAGELLSPVVALMNTTYARGRAVDSRTWFDKSFYQGGKYFQDRARMRPIEGSEADAGQVIQHVDGYYRVMLDGTKFFLPLGWHLSGRTRTSVDSQKSVSKDYFLAAIRKDLMAISEAPQLRR